jgi:cytolysin-activating lysine-acyltransferase
MAKAAKGAGAKTAVPKNTATPAKANGKAAASPTKSVSAPKSEAVAAANPVQDIRNRAHAEIGQIVLAMMNLPRYRHLSIAELKPLVVDPLIKDRIAVARAKQGDGVDALVGIAIWASVSDAVEGKIKEQIRAGVLPIRLGPDDWTSGEKIWLIDVIAANQKLATAVLVNFRTLSGGQPVQIHPIVSRSVDKDVLDRLKVRPQSRAAS